MRLHLDDGLGVMFGQWALTLAALWVLAYVLRWIFAEDGKHPMKEKIVKFLYKEHKIPLKVKVVFWAMVLLGIIVLAITEG